MRVPGWMQLFGLCVLIPLAWRFPWITVVIIAAGVLMGMLEFHHHRRLQQAARLEEERRQGAWRQYYEDQIRYRADLEHWHVQNHDLRGYYGQYEPPPEMRGTGIWVPGEKGPGRQP